MSATLGPHGILLAGEAQQSSKVDRIGYLTSGSPTTSPHLFEVFRQALQERGWVEGQNIAIDYRYAERRYDRLPDLASELLRLKADVVVGSPAPSAAAAKKATGRLPSS